MVHTSKPIAVKAETRESWELLASQSSQIRKRQAQTGLGSEKDKLESDGKRYFDT